MTFFRNPVCNYREYGLDYANCCSVLLNEAVFLSFVSENKHFVNFKINLGEEMKRFLAILSLLILVSVPALAQKKVGIVFDAGGKNDRSFNQSAWEGALRAQEELGILLKDA